MTEYSVLMPLWHGENPLFLKQSLLSMASQTIPPVEYVFVLDHPIAKNMKNLIQEIVGSHAKICYVEVYQLEGHGLGALLREGVLACSCSFVARMDSDDIALPSRCEQELYYLNDPYDYHVVGSFLTEFQHNTDQPSSIRKVPECGPAFTRFAKFRNPLNHPTVMFQRDAVLAAGNYNPHYSYCEDYELWYRMLKADYSFYNLQESLLFYRSGNDFLERRSRKGNLKSYVHLKKQMRRDGFINCSQYVFSIVVQWCFSQAPHRIKKNIYRLLRKT